MYENWAISEDILKEVDYKQMTMLDYYKAKQEMLNDLGRVSDICNGVPCKICPLNLNPRTSGLACAQIEHTNPLEAIKIVVGYHKNKKGDNCEQS